jgi:hypothetical protein
MTVKHFRLFIIVCTVDGPLIVGGSILGAAFGQRGLFAGAIVGGLIGIIVAVRLALWRGWISVQNQRNTLLGGIIGFAVAALIATNNLHTPVIPALSGLLIGAGAVIGSLLGKKA